MTRWWPRSLFGKLLLAQVAIIVSLAVALPVVLSRSLGATADGFGAERLARTATVVTGRLDAGMPTATLDRLAEPRRRGGRSVGVFDTSGRLLARTSVPPPFGLRELAHGGAITFEKRGRYDILTHPVARGGHVVGWVAVMQDRTGPEEIVDDVVGDFLRRFLWVVPVALLASLALSLLVMRRVTGNFRRAATDADRIGLVRLDARISEALLPTEAGPLVRATNRAIDRLEAGYHAQGEFVGNVAHELRTPLALLSLHTEQLLPSAQRDQLQHDIAQANHVVRQLMELAAIDRLHPERMPVDAADLARGVVEAMAPIVYGAGHSIALEEPDRPPPKVSAVRELLAIALTNLVDNAVRHTPAGSAITVIVEADGSLAVEDDGPGLVVNADGPAARRFRRRDTARSDSAGLGLSIVERIMTVCGGALEAGRSTAGGARLRLRLKAAEA